MYNLNWEEGFDGRAKLSDGRATARVNALPCPPLATPMLAGIICGNTFGNFDSRCYSGIILE